MSGLALVNPLTPFVLARTLFFQVGVLGIGVLITYLWFLPRFERWNPSKANKLKYVLSWLAIYTLKAVPFILLVGTLGVLLTDVGWLDAFKQYSGINIFLMARASGTPNGAHLLSYIPLPILGLYVAYKYRKDYLLDCFQGILIVAFGVAFHELPWLVAYLARYYGQLGLFLGSNFIEDAGFGLMCVMFVYAYHKAGRIPLHRFAFALYVYSTFLAIWFIAGLQVTTINNFQLGTGPFQITEWWADPTVNAIEIASWILVTVLLFWESRSSR